MSKSTTQNVPMTLTSPMKDNYTLAVVIGDNAIAAPQPVVADSYWILVVDRTSLGVVYNAWWNQPDTAPDLSKFDDPKYMLLVIGYALTTSNVPTGAFYDFLIDNGAGAGIRTAIQVYQQLGCGSFNSFAYILVGQLGPGLPQDFIGIENVSMIYNPVGIVSALELVPIDVSGTTYYCPSRLAN